MKKVIITGIVITTVIAAIGTYYVFVIKPKKANAKPLAGGSATTTPAAPVPPTTKPVMVTGMVQAVHLVENPANAAPASTPSTSSSSTSSTPR